MHFLFFLGTVEVKPVIRSKTNSMEMISSWPFISTCAVSKNKYKCSCSVLVTCPCSAATTNLKEHDLPRHHMKLHSVHSGDKQHTQKTYMYVFLVSIHEVKRIVLRWSTFRFFHIYIFDGCYF